jgi:hypothetical protein
MSEQPSLSRSTTSACGAFDFNPTTPELAVMFVNRGTLRALPALRNSVGPIAHALLAKVPRSELP